MSALAGKRVVVTRARKQAETFCAALERLGAHPIVFPTIEIRPLEDTARLDRAIAGLESFTWIVFTSTNGAEIFLDRLAGLPASGLPDGVRVAAVGPSTRRALESRGLRVDVEPHEHRGDRIPELLGDVAGKRVLLPRAEEGRDAIVELLRRRGALVEDVPVYRTAPAVPDPEAWRALRAGVDVITFTSPSTVRRFVALLGDGARPLLESATVACIGQVTADAARDLGIRVDVEPPTFTLDALIHSLAAAPAHARAGETS